MNKQIVYILVFLPVFLFSQSVYNTDDENKDEVDLLIDDLFSDDDEITGDDDILLQSVFLEQKELEELINGLSDFKFLYYSLSYNSDTFFTGRDLGDNQYNLRPQVTYIDSKGFFATVSGIYYQKFDPNWDFISLGVGYGKSVGQNKNIRLTTSYSRFLYLNDLDNTFTNALSIGIGIRNKKANLGTRLSTTYSFGKENFFQLSSSSFARYKIFKNSKTSLFFRPAVNLIIGNQIVFTEPIIFEYEGVEYEEYPEKKIFDLLNVQLNLPLLLTFKNFDVDFSYNINLPQSYGYEHYKPTGFVNLSIGYLFEL